MRAAMAAAAMVVGASVGLPWVAAQDAPPAKAPAAPAFTETFGEAKADLGPDGVNPFFSLVPKTVLVLTGTEDGEPVELVITVLPETKVVDGVTTRVVEERETEGGELKEVSRNYFAISKRTNSVYYFGEAVDMYRDGQVVGHGGAWVAGEQGARWGLMIPGTPLLGGRYYQEIAKGVAMDRAEIASVSHTCKTPSGTYHDCLRTIETTPLEPGAREAKVYARGIGLIKDGALRLKEVRRP